MAPPSPKQSPEDPQYDQDAEIPDEDTDPSPDLKAKETLTPAANDPEADKWIGKGLKLPQVQDDGRW